MQIQARGKRTNPGEGEMNKPKSRETNKPTSRLGGNEQTQEQAKGE